ncbi:YqjF family protein [Cryptosporangium sp. NPDC048952]|uniref:YqjF family protein n=1 Tax=Cryptosporangium sp. NPDC048952 TaxID=3363961 RepID=UPI00371E574F
MSAEPVTLTAPRTIERAIMTQWWRDLAFLHWPVEPGAVAPLLPPGTEPDTLDGVTYVGLIGFTMDRVGLGVGVPYFGRFAETNVRLYSVDAAGRRGVVFRSLDAARLLPVVIGRSLFGLNYVWSKMSVHHEPDGAYAYRSVRRWPDKGPHAGFTVFPGAPSPPSPLNDFLTARWGLHTVLRGKTIYLPNDHPIWPLRTATLLGLDESLLKAAGLPGIQGPPPSVLFSHGVPVKFGAPLPSN